MADQLSINTLSYARPNDSTTTSTTLETEYRVSTPSANKVLVEEYMTLDPANVAQVSTVTLTAGTTGDEYVVVITGATETRTYRHHQGASDTATTMAAFLATIINTHPDLTAAAAAGVITLKSAVPGQAFTVANTGSTTTGNVVVATTTANSGTGLHRKIGEATLEFSINDTGYSKLSCSGKWYDGASSPVLTQSFGPLEATHNKTVDALQTAQGVARTA